MSAREPLAVVSLDRRKGVDFGENEDEQEQWEFDGATIKRVLDEDSDWDWQALVQEAIKNTPSPMASPDSSCSGGSSGRATTGASATPGTKTSSWYRSEGGGRSMW